MKASVKSSLPTAAILFFAVSVIVWFVQNKLDLNLAPIRDALAPYLSESVFTSDGSLVHVVRSPVPHERYTHQRHVYDETLSAKTLSLAPESFHKEYLTKEVSINAVHRGGDGLVVAESMALYGASPVWWNGPEGRF